MQSPSKLALLKADTSKEWSKDQVIGKRGLLTLFCCHETKCSATRYDYLCKIQHR